MGLTLKKIIEKHKELIDSSKIYITEIKDAEHDINHIEDVIENIVKIAARLNKDFDIEVCVIAGYWHDVGRSINKSGHEKKSADMLKKEMTKLNYSKEFINKCYSAIELHKWDMKPKTIEGIILKDADKLAWLGKGRWISCLKNGQKLDGIIKLLPMLRNEILYLEESKMIFDDLIVEIFKLLYLEIYHS